jgi:hypothetical protein
MSQPITTLVVRASESDMTANTASTHLATSIANAVSTGRLAIQKNGTFVAGDATSVSSDLIKLSVAINNAATGRDIIVSTPEFSKDDIVSSDYKKSTSAGNQIIAVDYNGVTAAQKLGGQFFVRIESQGQGTGEFTETYSGTTLQKMIDQFNKRKAAGTTAFEFVSMDIQGSTVLRVFSTRVPLDGSLVCSANDGASISTTAVGAEATGQKAAALELERKSNIRSGVTNQIGFPIVEPATFIQPADYGIYTIEIEREAGHNNKVKEEFKVLIKDDEANASLTVGALQSVLGLSTADTTAPTLSTAVFSIANGNTASDSSYSVGGDTAMFVKLAGAAAAGDTVTVTVTSAATGDTGHNNVTTHTLVTETDNITLGVTAGDFTASTELTATTVITDAAGNVSATKTDTVTTAS